MIVRTSTMLHVSIEYQVYLLYLHHIIGPTCLHRSQLVHLHVTQHALRAMAIPIHNLDIDVGVSYNLPDVQHKSVPHNTGHRHCETNGHLDQCIL